MAVSLPADDEFAPTEFSPPPELVRIAVIVLAVAGVAGLWKGAADAIQEGPISAPPPAAAGPRTVPVVAKPLPAVGATSDTLLPTRALAASVTPPPAPAPSASRKEAAPVETEPVAPLNDRLDVEITPPAPPPAASAAPQPRLPAGDEIESPPLAETEPPPPDEMDLDD